MTEFLRKSTRVKKSICKIVIGCIVLTTPVAVLAAGRTAGGYKNNSFIAPSDASSFINGITSNATGYTTEYKKDYSVVNTDFYKKDRTIKYWSSHGLINGYVYGDANSVSLNIFDTPPAGYGTSFNWTGGNLEFVLLSACSQLGDFSSPADGGKNNRAKYASAMIGSNAVRVIAGYHASAPARTSNSVFALITCGCFYQIA